MRTIGFRSNILFAIAAAFGVIAALGRPWYGPEAPVTDARMEDLFAGIGRAFTEPEGTIGWAALQTTDALLAGLAVGSAVLLALALVPSIQRHMQPLARWCALATVGVVLYALLEQPPSAAMAETRHGAFIELASALVLLASAWSVASGPARRRTAPRSYNPPQVPVPAPARDAERWGPPQY